MAKKPKEESGIEKREGFGKYDLALFQKYNTPDDYREDVNYIGGLPDLTQRIDAYLELVCNIALSSLGDPKTPAESYAKAFIFACPTLASECWDVKSTFKLDKFLEQIISQVYASLYSNYQALNSFGGLRRKLELLIKEVVVNGTVAPKAQRVQEEVMIATSSKAEYKPRKKSGGCSSCDN